MPPRGAGHVASLSPSKRSRLFLLTCSHFLDSPFFPNGPHTRRKCSNAAQAAMIQHSQRHEDKACCGENQTSFHMSDPTETSLISNPITVIDHRESILKVDEQSLLPNYRDRKIIIEAGCGCHCGSNEIILLS